MKNTINTLIILSFIILSCKNPNSPDSNNILNNDNTNNNINDNMSYVTKEYIDNKFPYWKNLTIMGFFIDESIGKKTTITKEEKEYIFKSIAFLRLLVNTDEFETTVLQSTAPFQSSITASYEGGKYNIKKGEKYDKARIVEVVRSIDHIMGFTKGNYDNGFVAYATSGESRYVFYGYKENLKTGDSIILPNLNWKSEFANGSFTVCSSIILHEYMHNIGFLHERGYNTPVDMQKTISPLLLKIYSGELKSKYQNSFEELQKYYYQEYKDLLETDNIYNP